MLPKFSSQFGDVTGGLLSMSPISLLTSRSKKMKKKKKEKKYDTKLNNVSSHKICSAYNYCWMKPFIDLPTIFPAILAVLI